VRNALLCYLSVLSTGYHSSQWMTKIFYKKHFNAKKFTAKGFYKRKFAFSTAEVTHTHTQAGSVRFSAFPTPSCLNNFQE
jgi:hypothetical protein